VIAGSTFDSMKLAYFRDQRASLKEPATIGDIPFEVIKKGLMCLSPDDLLSVSLSCRAFRPAAIEILLLAARFDVRRQERSNKWLCGLGLKSLVFGRESYTIKSLNLKLKSIGIGRVNEIVRLVSHSLTNLSLTSDPSFPNSSAYFIETLEIFFLHCPWIQDLKLISWDLRREENIVIPQSVKEGFGRLTRLSIEECCDISLLVEHLNEEKLSSFAYYPTDGSVEEDAIILSVLMKCPKLIDLNISPISTPSFIPKVVERCRLLKKFAFYVAELEKRLGL
jgi:hypothetical protein